MSESKYVPIFLVTLIACLAQVTPCLAQDPTQHADRFRGEWEYINSIRPMNLTDIAIEVNKQKVEVGKACTPKDTKLFFGELFEAFPFMGYLQVAIDRHDGNQDIADQMWNRKGELGWGAALYDLWYSALKINANNFGNYDKAQEYAKVVAFKRAELLRKKFTDQGACSEAKYKLEDANQILSQTSILPKNISSLDPRIATDREKRFERSIGSAMQNLPVAVLGTGIGN